VVGILLVMIIGAQVASALSLSGVGLIAFVPLVGLAVFPLQIVALIVRGLVFEYLGLTALGAYLTLYMGHRARPPLNTSAAERPPLDVRRAASGFSRPSA
jgi:hypothetical protein